MTCREAWTYHTGASVGWANTLTTGMIDGLSRLGFKTTVLRCDGSPQRSRSNQVRFHKRVATGERFVFVDINVRSNLDFSRAPTAQRFSFIIDSPMDDMERLTQIGESTILGLADRQRLPILDAVRLDRRKVFFSHASPHPADAPRSMAERDIDVLFAGHVYPKPGSDAWNRLLPDLPKIIDDMVEVASTEVTEEGEGAFKAFYNACARIGFDPADLDSRSLCRVNRLIERRAETSLRHQALSQLRGLNIHFFGQVLDGGGGLSLPNATLHGERDSGDIVGFMKRAKIVLNCSPKLCYGSHERIWYGIANGSVGLTSHSHYLAETFSDDESIIFMPPDLGHLGERIADLVNDNQRLDCLAGAAMPIYRKNHAWRERAKFIDRVLND